MSKDKSERAAIADTIYQQMGGNRMKAMVGGYNFLILENGLSFKFKGCRTLNYMKILLTPQDTYYVEFGRIRKFRGVPTYSMVKQYDDVYAEDLQRLFTDETGLYTRL